MRRKPTEARRVVEHAVGQAPVFSAAIVAGAVAGVVVVPELPCRRGDAIEVVPGVVGPVVGRDDIQCPTETYRAERTLQADGGFALPERLRPCALGRPCIQV